MLLLRAQVVTALPPLFLKSFKRHVAYSFLQHDPFLVKKNERGNIAYLVETGNVGVLSHVHYLDFYRVAVLLLELGQNFGHLDAGGSARRHQFHEHRFFGRLRCAGY